MNYRPAQLSLKPLREIAPGSICRILSARGDIDLFIRGGEMPSGKILQVFLGGEHHLRFAPFEIETLALVVAEADQVVLELGNRQLDARSAEFGMMAIGISGAAISIKGIGHDQKVVLSLDSWLSVDQDFLEGPLVFFDGWNLGRVNSAGAFERISGSAP